MKIIPVIADRAGRFLFILLLFCSTFSYAMFQGGFVSWFLFYVTLPFLVYALCVLFVREKIILIDRRFEPNRVKAGDDLVVTVKVKRKTFFPFAYVTLQELREDVAIPMRTLKFAGFKREFEWQYQMQNIARGEHRFESLEVTFHDFFGWVSKKEYFKQSQTLIVYPRVHDMEFANIQVQHNSGMMSSVKNMDRDTSIVTGVRNYQAGDRVAWIHWKTFAKSQLLYTKEFEDRKVQELLLFLDRSPSNYFEDVVELTASIIQMVVKKQGKISLISVGEERNSFPSIQTASQFENVMYHLAKVKADLYMDWASAIYEMTQGATYLIVTAEMTEAKLVTCEKMLKRCIILVVTENISEVKRYSQKAKGVQLIAVPRGEYLRAFTEVMKP